MSQPGEYGWEKAEDGEGERYRSRASFTEYRNGLLYEFKDHSGAWYRYDKDDEPIFRFEVKDGREKGFKVSVFDAEISVEYPFENQNGTTTHYSITIRRSTGRFTEAFEVENSPAQTHLGSCLIYK